ncbi:MAG TPA: hypothetical protein VLA33_08415 [Gemmatimonadota bacterium]|nr:hypothetical protein [Gemmatimonadota bacterium]
MTHRGLNTSRGRTRALVRAGTALLLAGVLIAGTRRTAAAQGVPAAYGFVAGTFGGAYVTTGVFVAKARAGSYLYSLDDALAPRWEIVPAVAMPIGGFLLGLDDGQRLASSLAWGSAGFAVGTLVGLGAGELFGTTNQGRWAGAIIGSAAGLLAGSIYGALTYDPPDGSARLDGSGIEQPALVIRFPL